MKPVLDKPVPNWSEENVTLKKICLYQQYQYLRIQGKRITKFKSSWDYIVNSQLAWATE